MYLKLIILNILFLFHSVLEAQPLDQYAHINFIKNMTDHKINMTSSNTTFSNTTFMQESDVNLMDSDDFEFKFHKGIYATDDFTIEFQIEKKLANILSIGFRYLAINPVDHDMYTFFFTNGTYKIETPTGDFLASSDYTSDDIFRIDKCQGFIAFYISGKLLAYYEAMDHTYEASLYLNEAESTNCFMHYYHYDELVDCPLPYDANNYMVVKTAVFDDCAVLPDSDKLNFYYLQKYAIVDGQNDEIQIKLYNEKHEPIQLNQGDAVQTQKYGSNFFSIDLSSYNLSDVSYLLEVMGPNKESTYYLKFKLSQ